MRSKMSRAIRKNIQKLLLKYLKTVKGISISNLLIMMIYIISLVLIVQTVITCEIYLDSAIIEAFNKVKFTFVVFAEVITFKKKYVNFCKIVFVLFS